MMVLDTLKSRIMTAKSSTAEVVAAAGSTAKHGFATIAPKGFSASLKTPLFDESAPLMETSAPSEASAESVDTRATGKKKADSAGHAVRLVKSSTGKLATRGGAVADIVMRKINSMLRLPGPRISSKCVEHLVGMGFALKDITRAVRATGTDDLSTVIEFLCQDPVEQMLNMGFSRDAIDRAVHATGTSQVSSVVAFICHEPIAMTRDRRDRVAQGIARRMLEVEFDESEDVQLALALSKFEAEISGCNGGDLPDESPFKEFQWWESSSGPADACAVMEASHPNIGESCVHLLPSVGTWMLPKPRHSRSIGV
mmetsp:Transcript_109163/g.172503  ORF Transcript_109163/g.172503 Transcript_109163/m.172503 type:complete len:312 (-) Transcript_109163:170-1105(-)